MMLTKGVEQAICIIVLLATQESNAPLASDEISRRLEVSPSYMKKIMRKLVVKKLVTSVPGTNGGISLAKDLEDIHMLEVIEAMEGPIAIFPDSGLIRKAFENGPHVQKGESLLRQVFRQADGLLIDYFSNITAADLLKESLGTNELPLLDWNKTSLGDYLNQKSGEKK
ncbi:RrF2 family transcriptional regulator [Mesobacillus foraminis]|uniref:BadM/Rrf2 family transcriptional regulator n=1 Tax=Mesobacillus foraminis TaxID=279826 RepID=A0A4R2BFB5_9BACI|nr:Rrf2 family transcriptional regulator [Mesobacillus foraminis]MBT2757704.1 Rrf2 family transcriptional regulator [Mesobacillus foraminis]TCN25155.1 BadM/Rrf2 family transcriptional regulator [Mesobacillus foraminis]